MYKCDTILRHIEFKLIISIFIFQLVVVSHWMDASFVYGSNQRLADTLREGIGGRLRVEFRDGRPWPPAAANKSAVCDQQTDEEPCYQFG